MPDGPRRLGHEHGRAQRRPIAVARVRVPDRAERRPGQRDAGVERVGQALQQHAGRRQPVGDLPERRRPTADHALVVVVERPHAVPGDVEHVAAEDAEAEAQQDVEVVAAQLVDRRGREVLGVPPDAFGRHRADVGSGEHVGAVDPLDGGGAASHPDVVVELPQEPAVQPPSASPSGTPALLDDEYGELDVAALDEVLQARRCHSASV